MQRVVFYSRNAGNLHAFGGSWDPSSCYEHPPNGRVQCWMVLGLGIAQYCIFDVLLKTVGTGYKDLCIILPGVILMLKVFNDV